MVSGELIQRTEALVGGGIGRFQIRIVCYALNTIDIPHIPQIGFQFPSVYGVAVFFSALSFGQRLRLGCDLLAESD